MKATRHFFFRPIVLILFGLTPAVLLADQSVVDYADVEWARPVNRTVAVPVEETQCDPLTASEEMSGGDIRVIDPAVGLVEAIRSESRRRPVRPRCRVVRRTDYRDEFAYYEVRYRYAGESYTRRLSYDPGERIKVRIEVRAGR